MECRGTAKIIQKFLLFILTFAFLISHVSAGTVIYAVNTDQNVFQIDFIDVGQGDSVLVKSKGHYMLVDGGNSKQSSLIYSYLKSRSISNLDVMVATHADADHIGGLSGALNYATVGVAYCPVTEHDTKTFKSFVRYLGYQGKSITVPKAGDTFMIGSATVTVVGPIASASDANNSSIVLRIQYGDTSFLLTGDAEYEEETAILNSGQGIQSTVLKVAHHGSAYSTGYRFLREVAPQYAVISVGNDNKYGHPIEAVLSRLRDADVKTYRTDMQGDIICRSDGKTVSFSVEKNADADTLADAGLGQKAGSAAATYFCQKSTNNSLTTSEVSDTGSQRNTGAAINYVLNRKSKRFHVPTCNSVSQMNESNKIYFTGTRQEAVDSGYVPCKRCNPQEVTIRNDAEKNWFRSFRKDKND